MILRLVLVFAIGAAGGLGATALRIPGGGVIGSMLAVAVANLALIPEDVTVPQYYRMAAQIIIGVVIGSGITREALVLLKGRLLLALLLPLGLMANGILFAWLLKRFAGVDVITALFSTAPAGMADMTAMAISQGGDGLTVSSFHLIRIALTVLLMPFLARFLEKVI